MSIAGVPGWANPAHEPMPDVRRQQRRWPRVRGAGTVLALFVAAAVGCRSSSDGRGTAGQRCSGDRDCADGLACVEQRCAPAEREPTARPRPLTPGERDDCRRLIHRINEESAKYSTRSAETPVELLRMADAIGGAAKRIAALEVVSPELRTLRDAYAAMTAELGKAARDAGTAGSDGDKRRAALATMETIGPREDRLLGKINAFCGAR